MNLNMGPNADPNVDNYGHLGGLITGIFAGFAISEQYDADAKAAGRTPDRFTDEDWENRCCSSCVDRCCQILLIVWIVGLLVIFYVFVDVDVDQGSID